MSVCAFCVCEQQTNHRPRTSRAARMRAIRATSCCCTRARSSRTKSRSRSSASRTAMCSCTLRCVLCLLYLCCDYAKVAKHSRVCVTLGRARAVPPAELQGARAVDQDASPPRRSQPQDDERRYATQRRPSWVGLLVVFILRAYTVILYLPDNIWAAGQGNVTPSLFRRYELLVTMFVCILLPDGTVHRLGLEKSLISTSTPKSPQFVPIKCTLARVVLLLV